MSDVREPLETPITEPIKPSNEPEAVCDEFEVEKVEENIAQDEGESEEMLNPENPYDVAIASLHDIKEKSKELIESSPKELFDYTAEHEATQSIEAEDIESDCGSNELIDPPQEVQKQEIDPEKSEESFEFTDLDFAELDMFLKVPEDSTSNHGDPVVSEAHDTNTPSEDNKENVDAAETERIVPKISIYEIFGEAEKTESVDMPAKEESDTVIKEEPTEKPNNFLLFAEEPNPVLEKPEEIENLVNDLFTGNLASPENRIVDTDELVANVVEPQTLHQKQEPPQAEVQTAPQAAPQVAVQQANPQPTEDSQAEIKPSPVLQELPSKVEEKQEKSKATKKRTILQTILMALLILLLIFIGFQLVTSISILLSPEADTTAILNQVASFSLLAPV